MASMWIMLRRIPCSNVTNVISNVSSNVRKMTTMTKMIKMTTPRQYVIQSSLRRLSVLSDRFEAAVGALNTVTTTTGDVSNDTKLRLYALYKQATEGACNSSKKPSFFDIVGNAKFDAWSKLGNMSKDDAMTSYINVISELTGKSTTQSSDATSSDKDSNGYILRQFAYPRQQQSLGALNHKLITSQVTDGIATITLNRPKKGNAFNMLMWKELMEVFQAVNNDSNAKVAILQGSSSHFSTGMDLEVFVEMNAMAGKEKCEGRKREALSHIVQFYQDCISSPERSVVPVIAAIHGGCIGGAIDLITACDMRYCTADTTFSIKETDLAIVADIGTLQRLPKLIGDSQTRELAYTGRDFNGKEAEELGLVLKCFPSKDEMLDHVNKVAAQIASKSPLTIRGIKKTCLYTRDHSVIESLEQVKALNASQLYSNDLLTAMMAYMKKTSPNYNDP